MAKRMRPTAEDAKWLLHEWLSRWKSKATGSNVDGITFEPQADGSTLMRIEKPNGRNGLWKIVNDGEGLVQPSFLLIDWKLTAQYALRINFGGHVLFWSTIMAPESGIERVG